MSFVKQRIEASGDEDCRWQITEIGGEVWGGFRITTVVPYRQVVSEEPVNRVAGGR